MVVAGLTIELVGDPLGLLLIPDDLVESVQRGVEAPLVVGLARDLAAELVAEPGEYGAVLARCHVAAASGTSSQRGDLGCLWPVRAAQQQGPEAGPGVFLPCSPGSKLLLIALLGVERTQVGVDGALRVVV